MEKPTGSKKRLKSYSSEYKLTVVNYAENTSNRAAERFYGVNECMIRKWRKKKDELKKPNAAKRQKLEGGGRKPSLGKLEEILVERVFQERANQNHVPCKLIQVWALDLARQNGFLNFKATRGWLSNFLQRFNLTIRRRTTSGQSLPKDLVPKVVSFIQFCKKQFDSFAFIPSAVVNMDETPIWADMPSTTTVEQKGASTIPIRTTGHEKKRITVALAIKSDGTKLKPYVVIPGKKVPQELRKISDVVVACSPNAWMNEELTIDWLNRVWGSLAFSKRMLVWDSFRCHVSENIKEHVKRKNTVMAVVPGGCTKLLQPLDVCVNKPFKDLFRQQYDEWFRKGEFELTRGGNMKAPSYKLQIEWIVLAWNKVSKDVVVRSFEVCGITTSNKEKISCVQKGNPAEDAYALLEDLTGNHTVISQAAEPTNENDVPLFTNETLNLDNISDDALEDIIIQ
jgi:transposase-like protein